jgi:hypothetical protein
VSTPNIPLPPPPPEPETADEAPTAEAELHIVLLPIRAENGAGDAAGQPRGPTGTAGGPTGQITQFVIAVVLITGTLFGARLAHLSPAGTAIAVLAELVTVLGLAQFRRISRHK